MDTMKSITVVLRAISLCTHITASLAAEPADIGTSTSRPNIIVMQPDDLQFFDEWSPPPNNPFEPNRKVSFPSTSGLPNIDGLRRNGLQMKQAYTASPMCGTSRYSTITGKYPSRAASVRENSQYYHYAYENGDPALVVIPTTKLKDVDEINDCSENNIAVQFQNNGYRTAMMGKWHLSSIRDDEYTYENAVEIVKGCGFSTVEGLYVENMASDPADFDNYSDGTFSHNMEWMTYEAIQFIKADDEEPFFLYFNPTVPHSSQDVGVALTDFTCQDTSKGTLGFDPMIPGMTKEYGTCADYRQSIFDRADSPKDYGPIWLDDSVGAIIKALEDKNILDNTIFLFQMDHGMETKAALYENGVRIPQFIHYPAKYSPGTTFDAPVSTVDIGATMLDFAGIEPTYELDGMSWRDVAGKAETDSFWKNDRCIFFEMQKDRAARCGCYKYLSIFEQRPRASSTYRRGNQKGLSNDLANFFNLCDDSNVYVTDPTTNMEEENAIDEKEEEATLLQSIIQCHLNRTDYFLEFPDYSPCDLSESPSSSPSEIVITAPPSSPPSTQFPCEDSPLKFKLKNRNRNCKWVARYDTDNRCKMWGVKNHCPKTCNKPSSCTKNSGKLFQLRGNWRWKRCGFFNTNSKWRCKKEGVKDTCRKSCAGF